MLNKKLMIILLLILVSFLPSCGKKNETNNIWPSSDCVEYKLGDISLTDSASSISSNTETSGIRMITIESNYDTFLDLAKQIHQAGYKYYYNESKDGYFAKSSYDNEAILYNYYDQGYCFNAYYKISNDSFYNIEMRYITSGNIIYIHLTKN